MTERKEIKTKTKAFVLLSLIILIAVLGCRFPASDHKNAALFVSIELAPPNNARKTITPYFNIYVYERIVFEVIRKELQTVETEVMDDETGESYFITEEVVAEIIEYSTERDPRTQSLTIDMEDLPYGIYTLIAKAYVRSSHADDNYAAYGEIEFEYKSNSYLAEIPLVPLIGQDHTYGVLRYRLINAIGEQITSELFYLDESYEPDSKITLNQGLNHLDTVSGYYTEDLATGYYLYFFGKNSPSVIHIYKNMVTILEDEYSLFGDVSRIISPNGSDITVTITCEGKEVRDGQTLSYGQDVEVKIEKGNDFRYSENSIHLNYGDDDNWFYEYTDYYYPADCIYYRSFRMPPHDVIVNVDSELIPYHDLDFNNPNWSGYVRFRDSSGNITAAHEGQTVSAYLDYPGSQGIQFEIISWWLDNAETASTDPTKQTFTVPNPCVAWNLTAIVNIENVPHSVSIPIAH